MATFTTSQRGKDKLCLGGFVYLKHCVSKQGVATWHCDQRRTKKCGARLQIQGGQEPKLQAGHNHSADPARCQIQPIKSKLSQLAKESLEIPSCVVARATVSIPASLAVQLPSPRSMTRNIRRIRQKAYKQPLPTNTRNIDLPEELQQTSTGERFLLHDSGPSENRIMIFSTAKNLEYLAKSTFWHMDGTFATTPRIFEQLYTIHCTLEGSTFPVVYVLLTKKTRDLYTAVFQAIHQLKNGLRPANIMIDFEYASMDALQNCFPEALIRGCYFHFQQSLWRKIQGIATIYNRYRDDPEFAVLIRHLSALAFRKLEDVRPTYVLLCSTDFFQNPSLRSLLDYFEYTWVGVPPTGQIRWWTQPLFSIRMWNVHDAVNQDWARTNNAVEGWHSRLTSIIGCSHPNMYKFVKSLQQEEDQIRLNMNQLEAGANPPPRKKRYVLLNEKLARIVANYETLEPIEFLNRIAHNLVFESATNPQDTGDN